MTLPNLKPYFYEARKALAGGVLAAAGALVAALTTGGENLDVRALVGVVVGAFVAGVLGVYGIKNVSAPPPTPPPP
jgi:hypothetical protein